MSFSEIVTAVDDAVWGYPLLILLVGVGLFLSIRLGFIQFGKFGHAMKNTAGKIFEKKNAGKGEVTPFQALCTALAATVGTGNIVGVTSAVVIGGPGAVFWMWIAALLGMCTKFCEVLLSVKYRERNAQGDWVGGPMYYIKNGLGKKWGWLGALFCIFGGLAAFGIGNATQVQSIASAINNAIDQFGGNTSADMLTLFGSQFKLSTLIIAVVIAIIVALVIIGGIKRIGSVTEKIVPFMSIVYIIATLVVVFADINVIGEVFRMIFVGAFSPEAIVGGGIGITVLSSMKKGVGRGCFSNEAGLGSAPMAHAATSETNPVKQGLFGIFEVFVDTIVICSLTCLTVLCSYVVQGGTFAFGDSSASGAELVAGALGSVFSGPVGAIIIAVCLSLFALSTVLSWSLYGVRCCGYLFKDSKVAMTIYKILFILFVIMGATLSMADAWNIADILNGLMAVPNLIAVVALSPVIVKSVKEYFAEVKAEKKAKKAAQ